MKPTASDRLTSVTETSEQDRSDLALGKPDKAGDLSEPGARLERLRVSQTPGGAWILSRRAMHHRMGKLAHVEHVPVLLKASQQSA